MFNNKQKRFLRAQGNALEPIVFVGKGEVSANVIKQLDEALIAHELVKVRVLKNCMTAIDDVVIELSSGTLAEEIQVIGNNILFYRQNPDKPKIMLPK
jgi:RNA-binding protein